MSKIAILLVYKKERQREGIREFLRLLAMGGKIEIDNKDMFSTPDLVVYLRKYDSASAVGLRVDRIFIFDDYETDLDILCALRLAEVGRFRERAHDMKIGDINDILDGLKPLE